MNEPADHIESDSGLFNHIKLSDDIDTASLQEIMNKFVSVFLG